jgi:hypothetical protein
MRGPLVGLLLIACAACAGPPAGDRVPSAPIEVVRLERPCPPVRTTAVSGDTLETISRRLAGRDWVAWRDALVAQLDPRRLQPGTVFEGVQTWSGELRELKVVLDLRDALHLHHEGGQIRCERVSKAVASEVLRLDGEITSSLFGAVDEAGGRPELAVQMAEIFQWDIDFLRDIRIGDQFVVIVDLQTVDGAFYRYGTVYACRFVNNGRTLNAVAYPDADGRLGYYDLEGQPMRKMFLRCPLKFSRITSRFSHSRFHPVLKRRLPHYGIDYGAPSGTPVHVTADGTVTLAGRNGGAGRMVRVRHPNGFETNYLHLSRFGPGIRSGARVAQGQVIGYVGSTGLSTGPHLDYRVKQNGRWINPLTIASPPVEPLQEELLGRFTAHALAVLALLEGKAPPAGAMC